MILLIYLVLVIKQYEYIDEHDVRFDHLLLLQSRCVYQVKIAKLAMRSIRGSIIIICFITECIGLSTDPVSVNGETPILSAPSGPTNVMVYCAVLLTNGNPTVTSWQLILSGQNGVFISFDNGFATVAGINFTAIGDPIGNTNRHSNLTILNYASSIDNALLDCGRGNTVLANFTLRVISKC